MMYDNIMMVDTVSSTTFLVEIKDVCLYKINNHSFLGAGLSTSRKYLRQVAETDPPEKNNINDTFNFQDHVRLSLRRGPQQR